MTHNHLDAYLGPRLTESRPLSTADWRQELDTAKAEIRYLHDEHDAAKIMIEDLRMRIANDDEDHRDAILELQTRLASECARTWWAAATWAMTGAVGATVLLHAMGWGLWKLS